MRWFIYLTGVCVSGLAYCLLSRIYLKRSPKQWSLFDFAAFVFVAALSWPGAAVIAVVGNMRDPLSRDGCSQGKGDAENLDKGMVDLRLLNVLYECNECGVQKKLPCHEALSSTPVQCFNCGSEMSLASGDSAQVKPVVPDTPLYKNLRELGQNWINLRRYELEWEEMDETLERAYGVALNTFVLRDRRLVGPPNPFDPNGAESVMEDWLDEQMELLPASHRRHINEIDRHLRELADESVEEEDRE